MFEAPWGSAAKCDSMACGALCEGPLGPWLMGRAVLFFVRQTDWACPFSCSFHTLCPSRGSFVHGGDQYHDRGMCLHSPGIQVEHVCSEVLSVSVAGIGSGRHPLGRVVCCRVLSSI